MVYLLPANIDNQVSRCIFVEEQSNNVEVTEQPKQTFVPSSTRRSVVELLWRASRSLRDQQHRDTDAAEPAV